MLPSFLITFREGLEAFLIVGIILSYLGKLQVSKYNKYIYVGVFFGIIISLIIAYIFQVIFYGLDDKFQHYLMIFILLFATIVLTYMVIWMANQSKQIKGEMEESIKQLVTTGNILGMVFLAFLAVLREGFESVLFFSSLSLESEISLSDGLTGAVLGLFLSVVTVYALMRGAKNIPIKAFFKYTGLLILIIAGGLFGSSISMMQASGIVPVYVQEVYNISIFLDDRSVFGTFLRALFGYNSSPTFLHLFAWSLYMISTITLWKKSHSHAK